MDVSRAFPVQRLVENVCVLYLDRVEKCERACSACRANTSFCCSLLLSHQPLCLLHLHTEEQNIVVTAPPGATNMTFQSRNPWNVHKKQTEAVKWLNVKEAAIETNRTGYSTYLRSYDLSAKSSKVGQSKRHSIVKKKKHYIFKGMKECECKSISINLNNRELDWPIHCWLFKAMSRLKQLQLNVSEFIINVYRTLMFVATKGK